MKRRKVYGILAVLVVLVLTITACGSKKGDYSRSDVNNSQNEDEVNDGASQDSQMQFDTKNTSADKASDTGFVSGAKGESTAAEINNSTALSTDNLQVQSNDKIIKRFNLEVETKDFDNLLKKLNDKIKVLEGYIESSTIGGQSYDDYNESRTADVVVRIPNKKTDEFVSAVSDSANVTQNSCTTQNVTLEYIDSQSRIDALKIEQKRLFAILEKTEDLKSIITLESRLSDIRYELGKYESQLRSLDNDVEYSTVTMHIREVDRITQVSQNKQSFAKRIKTGFSNSIYHISEGLKNFTVWFIVNLPYIFIWGILILIAVVVTRRIIKNKDRKKES